MAQACVYQIPIRDQPATKILQVGRQNLDVESSENQIAIINPQVERLAIAEIANQIQLMKPRIVFSG